MLIQTQLLNGFNEAGVDPTQNFIKPVYLQKRPTNPFELD